MTREQMFVEVRDVPTNDRREDERNIKLIPQGSGQMRPQGTERHSLGIRQVGQVRSVPIRFDDQVTQRRQTIGARLAVIDPEPVVAADELAF